MKNVFKKYRFVFMICGCVFLLVFGLMLHFDKAFANNVVFTVSGLFIAIIAFVRFVPLMKSLDNKPSVLMNCSEIILDLIIGIGMLVIAWSPSIETADFIWMFKYCVAFVLFLRGIVYLIEIAFFETKAEVLKFIIHTLLIMCASAIVVWENFDTEHLIWVFILLCILACLYCLGDSIISYNNYRKLYKHKEIAKEDAVKVEVETPQEKAELPRDYVN